jgi:hypothetical protein
MRPASRVHRRPRGRVAGTSAAQPPERARCAEPLSQTHTTAQDDAVGIGRGCKVARALARAVAAAFRTASAWASPPTASLKTSLKTSGVAIERPSRAEAIRAVAVPEATGSRHLRRPQPQAGPDGSSTMCPKCPASPEVPSCKWPSTTSPPPTPVETVTKAKVCQSRPVQVLSPGRRLGVVEHHRRAALGLGSACEREVVLDGEGGGTLTVAVARLRLRGQARPPGHALPRD